MDEIFYWGQSSTDSFNFLFSRIFTLQRFFTIFKSNLDFPPLIDRFDYGIVTRWDFYCNTFIELGGVLDLVLHIIHCFIEKLLLLPVPFYLPIMLARSLVDIYSTCWSHSLARCDKCSIFNINIHAMQNKYPHVISCVRDIIIALTHFLLQFIFLVRVIDTRM